MKTRALSVVTLIVFLYLLGYIVPRSAVPSCVHPKWKRASVGIAFSNHTIIPSYAPPVYSQLARWYDKVYDPLQKLDKKLTGQLWSPRKHRLLSDLL